jgi:hypothetical protein
VYGPHEDDLKNKLMQDLREVKASVKNKWMVLGDFKHICQTVDKCNANINQMPVVVYSHSGFGGY